MPSPSHPLQFVLVALAGWVNQQQRDIIHYLLEENRVLRAQIGARRLRFTDNQRRRVRCVYSIRSCRALVLVQQAAETVATFQRYRLRRHPRRC
jgi:hypothetical protein